MAASASRCCCSCAPPSIPVSSPRCSSSLAPLATPPQSSNLLVSFPPLLAREPIHAARKLPRPAKTGFQILAAGAEAVVETETQQSSALKQFLEELKSVGRIRIIVNTGVGVLESVTSLEKLFYHTVAGRGEYANLMNKEENVDFHLLLNKVAAAKFVKGKSMRGDIPTYTIRFLDDEDKAAALFLVMWKPGTNGDYDAGQVEAFEALLEKYGDILNFKK